MFIGLTTWHTALWNLSFRASVRIPFWPRNPDHSVLYCISRQVLFLSTSLELSPLQLVRGNTYQGGNRLLHNTGAFSIKWMPISSLLFDLVAITLLLRRLCHLHQRVLFILNSRVSTLIPVVPLSPGDSDRGKHGHFLFWFHNGRPAFLVSICHHHFCGKNPVGRPNSKVKARFIENWSVCDWCHFSTSVFTSDALDAVQTKFTVQNVYLNHTSWWVNRP